jgi:hypothetical protein
MVSPCCVGKLAPQGSVAGLMGSPSEQRAPYGRRLRSRRLQASLDDRAYTLITQVWGCRARTSDWEWGTSLMGLHAHCVRYAHTCGACDFVPPQLADRSEGGTGVGYFPTSLPWQIRNETDAHIVRAALCKTAVVRPCPVFLCACALVMSHRIRPVLFVKVGSHPRLFSPFTALSARPCTCPTPVCIHEGRSSIDYGGCGKRIRPTIRLSFECGNSSCLCASYLCEVSLSLALSLSLSLSHPFSARFATPGRGSTTRPSPYTSLVRMQ